jgi:pSer/pThr/pTyr-binding forkhead associated (FHA) protein
MKRSNDKSSGKIYQFVSLSEKSSLSIGRKKDVDVRISEDISVSRHHASISYDPVNHKFLLEDNRSKFGTLVLIKKSLSVRPNMKNVGFQIGAEVYRF